MNHTIHSTDVYTIPSHFQPFHATSLWVLALGCSPIVARTTPKSSMGTPGCLDAHLYQRHVYTERSTDSRTVMVTTEEQQHRVRWFSDEDERKVSSGWPDKHQRQQHGNNRATSRATATSRGDSTTTTTTTTIITTAMPATTTTARCNKRRRPCYTENAPREDVKEMRERGEEKEDVRVGGNPGGRHTDAGKAKVAKSQHQSAERQHLKHKNGQRAAVKRSEPMDRQQRAASRKPSQDKNKLANNLGKRGRTTD